MANLDPEIQQLVDQRVQEAMKAAGFVPGAPARRNRMAIVASKGSMDMAYMPLILASTAGAMEMECAIFFTFYGLQIIHKKNNKNLKVAPIANPAMIPGWSPTGVPNIIGMLPGMTAMATMMMKSWMAKEKVPSIPELLDVCVEGGVKLLGCQMSMDVMGIKKEQLVDGVETAGAGTFLGYAAEAAITLFV
ncbi:MAG TPA: DsrE/DsrF/DrsH-like family protein [Candidatus Methanoperedens sp.]|nr:DsrE/DsrF/DrsH-like family protein [Candidatus Methanoperedens sp.]